MNYQKHYGQKKEQHVMCVFGKIIAKMPEKQMTTFPWFITPELRLERN